MCISDDVSINEHWSALQAAASVFPLLDELTNGRHTSLATMLELADFINYITALYSFLLD